MGEPDRTATTPSAAVASADVRPDASAAPLADEVARLRAERDEAVATCRRLEHELGQQRGRARQLELMVYRRTMRRQRWLGRAQRVAGWLPGRRRR